MLRERKKSLLDVLIFASQGISSHRKAARSTGRSEPRRRRGQGRFETNLNLVEA